jgi:hypothetical protein
MEDEKPDFSYYQIGGFKPNLTLQRCSATFFSNYMRLISCGFRGPQYDMGKLAEAIIGPESTLELVLGTRF